MAAKSPRLVGLDIGTTGARAVEVEWQKKAHAYRITRAGAVEFPRGTTSNGIVADEKALAKSLKRLWRTGHFTTRKVVFGLTDAGVLTRQLDLPWMPAEDFKAALPYQVGDALPMDRSTVELDYHVLSEEERVDDNGQPLLFNRILLVAANADSVLGMCTILRSAGLEPVAADSTAFALIRAACQGQLPESGRTFAIVDIGADQLTLVVHQGGQPRFIRTIANMGGDTATEAVAERLRVEPEAAESMKREVGLNGPPPNLAPIAESTVFRGVADEPTRGMDPRISATVAALNPWAATVVGEIRNSLDYYQASDPNAAIEGLLVTGRTAELTGLIERIATQIPLPVRVMDPLVGLPASGRVAKHQPTDTRLVVAAGLALGQSA